MTTQHTDDTARDVAQVVEHDPVCGAAITDEAAAPSIEYEGRKHWFCSDECRELFAEEPDRFALDEDLSDEVVAQRSDGEAGVLADGPE
ncbi:MAG TPA: YHS domain-containing protein, partial [Planctomycetota bacterium]|nr:YHS domain-containing protein [Planctomycetota bacterium]